jgi:hypothetical protein
MRVLFLALATAAVMATGAETATAGPDAMRLAVDRVGMIEKSQFIYGGREHCFYPDGWHGPGWYWCGYNWRRGLGWGGPRGWHGWEWREHRGREFERHERREERRERRY